MAASFMAGFLIFLLTGAYSMYKGLDFAQDPFIKGSVIVALFFNAVYYFYTAAYTEMDEEVREKLQTVTRWEWIVRVVNQGLLLSLWFALDHSFEAFGNILVLTYATYLWWDWMVRGAFGGIGLLFVLDLVGFVDSIAFRYAGGNLAAAAATGRQAALCPGAADLASVTHGASAPTGTPTDYFFWGITAGIYVLLPFFGVYKLRFRPYVEKYRRRPELR